MAVALVEVADEAVHEKVRDTAVHGGKSSNGEENAQYWYAQTRTTARFLFYAEQHEVQYKARNKSRFALFHRAKSAVFKK